jgi:hypothetical protein
MANSSLGMVRVRQGKYTEAKPLLQKAVAASSQNYLVHFNYALALSMESIGADNRVSGFTAEAAKEMRSELKKAIDLSPTFPESYRLLAFINLVRGEEIDESIALLKRGLALSPGKGEFSFLLAQLYLRKDDFKTARQILEPLAREGAGGDPQLRANAHSLLESISRIEGQMSSNQSERGTDGSAGSGGQPPRLQRREDPSEEGLTGADERTGYNFMLRKPEAGEEQVLGLLLRLDCDAKGVTFVIKVGERQLKLRAADFNNINFTTFNPEVSGEITCGARTPPTRAVFAFRPDKTAKAKFDGVPVSIEFVPADFELKKQ